MSHYNNSLSIPADQCKIIVSNCSGFTPTKEEFIIREMADQYESIMWNALLEIMRLTGTVDITTLSQCSHSTKIRYEAKFRRLFGSNP